MLGEPSSVSVSIQADHDSHPGRSDIEWTRRQLPPVTIAVALARGWSIYRRGMDHNQHRPPDAVENTQACVRDLHELPQRDGMVEQTLRVPDRFVLQSHPPSDSR